MKYFYAILLILFTAFSLYAIVPGSVTDDPFIQEVHIPFPLDNDAANDVRSVAVDTDGKIWAATREGIYSLESGTWKSWSTGENKGPAYDISVAKDGSLWIGAWNGAYLLKNDNLSKIEGIDSPVSVIRAYDEVIALGPKGQWKITGNSAKALNWDIALSARDMIKDVNKGYWISTDVGLFYKTESDTKFIQNVENLVGNALTSLAWSQDKTLWIGGLGGITLYRNGKRVGHLTHKEGLISIDVYCLESAPDGAMWVGTKQGIARYNNLEWSMRYSRRWLLDNEVRDIAFDGAGNAWVATAGGVSKIERRTITMAQKADYYQRILEDRHIRPPYIVEKINLMSPGDTTKWEPRDDDNDGQYTSMYLAMESYRYQVTNNPKAKDNAKKAFDALKYLQTVTETDGFFARTVVPVEWNRMMDPNHVFTPQEQADRLVDNARQKYVPELWRLSSDGKWYWKGDTSSDEVTGHMYGYFIYYDLIAKYDKKEKKRVADHVCKIVDYIIDGGYNFIDIDGTHTKWGVWAPDKLNGSPDWSTEQYINSTELLSYLKLAYVVSGDQKYQDKYLELIHKHGYLENARHARSTNPTFITHIDDELLALAYPVLLMYEKDPEILKVYRQSVNRWHRTNEADNSPYFNFTYAALTGYDPNLDKSIAYLRDVSLDLVGWDMDLSKREDLNIIRYPEFENQMIDRMVPPSELMVLRWDRNPWYAKRGYGGRIESDGVFWLLPYWMGRYYGLIK